MLERIDEIEKYYTPIEKNDKIIWPLFLLSAFFSITIPYLINIPITWLQPLFEVSFITVVITYTLLSSYNNFYLIPKADKYRRKQLLSDSFGVHLTPEITELYYNNTFSPSIDRLGMSLLENSFFSKNVCYIMLKKERIKVLIYFILFVFAISYRDTELGLIIVLTQLFFSGEILLNYIKLEILRYQNQLIYDDLYAHYFHKIPTTSPEGIANILDLFASYESVKATASIKQSSKIFNALNPKLSTEWASISKKLLQVEVLEDKKKKKKKKKA